MAGTIGKATLLLPGAGRRRRKGWKVPADLLLCEPVPGTYTTGLPVVSGSQASLTSLRIFRFTILSCNRLSRLDFVKSTTTTTKKKTSIIREQP